MKKEKKSKAMNFRSPSENECFQLEEIIEEFNQNRIYLEDNYELKELTHACTSIAHSFGEYGRSYFLRLCENNDDLLPYEKENLYNKCLQDKWGKYSTIYTLFNIAKKYGVEIPEPLVSSTNPGTITNDVYKALPTFFKKISTLIESERERDIFLLSAITVLSGCYPMIKFVYRGREHLSNLYSFIIAPPGSGKSIMNFAKILAEKIHLKKRNETKVEVKIYNSLTKKEREYLEKPKQKMLFIPANISGAALIKTLKENDERGIIFETEADTLSGMFKQDWGITSDLLRNSFEHETLSNRRISDEGYNEIINPSIATLLSGTPNQVNKLIPEVENGLFSRFLFYFFNENSKFNNDIDKKYIEFNKEVKNASVRIYQYYLLCEKEKKSILFELTSKQLEIHQETFSKLLEEKEEVFGSAFSAVIKRYALIAIKFSMIFTILKLIENKEKPIDKIICGDKEFKISLRLVKDLIEHTAFVFDGLSMKSNGNKYSQIKTRFYKMLPERFTKGNAKELAIYLNINFKTSEKYLFEFRRDNRLEKEKHDVYRKIKLS